MNLQKKITGKEIFEEFHIAPNDLLKLMGDGLQAFDESGKNRVYNIDDDRNGPIFDDRHQAQSRYVINEMRKQRGQPPLDDISKFPEGYYGISFKFPNSEMLAQELINKIEKFCFNYNEVEQFLGVDDGKVIRKAQSEGFIKMIGLACALAGEEIYNDVLERLREIYLKPVLEKHKKEDDTEQYTNWHFPDSIPQECNISTTSGRYLHWMNLLQRWTKARADIINDSLEPIDSLSSYHGGNRVPIDLTQKTPDYLQDEIRIDEFIKYIQTIEYVHQFKISLPSWFELGVITRNKKPTDDSESKYIKEDNSSAITISSSVSSESDEKPQQFPGYPDKVVELIRKCKPEIESLYKGIVSSVPNYTSKNNPYDENLGDELADAAKQSYNALKPENVTIAQATDMYLFHSDSDYMHFYRNFPGKLCRLIISDNFPDVLPEPKKARKPYGVRSLYHNLYKKL